MSHVTGTGNELQVLDAVIPLGKHCALEATPAALQQGFELVFRQSQAGINHIEA